MTISEKNLEAPRINQADIAKKAGVSVATVNRALNGKAEVSAELYTRVQSAISELGYSWDRNRKRKSSTPRSGAVGLLLDLPNASKTGEFNNRFLVGVEGMAKHINKTLMLGSCEEDISEQREPLMIKQGLVDGLILKVPNANTRLLDWLSPIAEKLPVVLLMNIPSCYTLSSVTSDNASGMYHSIEHLHELGHRQIGFININDLYSSTNPSHLERQNAFIEIMQNSGMRLPEGYVQVPARENELQPLQECIGQALDNWLAMGSKRPTAIVCAADVYGLTLLEEAKKRGLKVPQDLSIIGVMNTPACEQSQPQLTSIDLSAQEIGKAAVELLALKWETPGSPARRIAIASHLVRRQSTSRPASKI
jgi:DNA-binding LacI/PurR family transcriptional regulator